jgi:predicted metalloprotease
MRIEDQSSNVEDRRGQSFGGRRGIFGGGIGVIILVIIGMFFGIDPRVILGLADTVQQVQVQPAQTPSGPVKAPSDEPGRFVSGVLADTEKTWGTLFRQLGRNYSEPGLVIFDRATDRVRHRQTAMGPSAARFDSKVYIDLLSLLRDPAPGDFAPTMVIAHEVGHHVQNQLGICRRWTASVSAYERAQYNALRCASNCRRSRWRLAHHAQNRNCRGRRRHRRCVPPPRSATTRSSAAPRVASFPRVLRTAAPSSACAGS